MQCYLLPYAETFEGKSVLLSRKQLLQYRLNGRRRTVPIVPNGAGQWGFSGGRQERGESPRTAAYREFFEETGVDLANEGVRRGYWPVGETEATLSDAEGRQFYVLYLSLAPDYLEQLREAIATNIEDGRVRDGELGEVAVIDLDTALGRIGPVEQPTSGSWDAFVRNAVYGGHPPPPLDVNYPRLVQRLSEQTQAPGDWYTIALDHLRDLS